jgi:hypothetical protein
MIGLFLSSAGVFAQSDDVALVQQANAAYLDGDYETAQVLYEQVIADGVRDPGVFFNLGSAYYQAGDLGRALVNYRIVQQYWPRDADLSRHLALVRAERLDLLGEETGFLEGLATLTTGVLSVSELSLLVGILWTATFFLIALLAFQPRLRERLRVWLVILVMITLFGLLLLGSRLHVDAFLQQGVVVQAVAQVRSGPGEQYLELYQLHSAAELHIWDAQNGWFRFTLPDGRLGWLPSQSIELINS